MNQKIKNYLSNFKNKLDKKWMILALLSFIIFVGFLLSQPAFAQNTLPQPPMGLNCGGWWDVGCNAVSTLVSGIGSILIKLAVLFFIGLPLIISAVIAGIMCLILGWIISADFISLKFTNNAFVNIGLSITRNFANMGFILFLVIIALATVLRIEEYKAKKTLPTLILIGLLVNFSPVFCGIIIDFSNIVMNFFLSNVTGLGGFANFLMNALNSIWNSLWISGFDIWANIGAAMQCLVSIIFNFYAAYIFVLFSTLFIVRYVMLWILVILSPIAFVSYILPITKRGQSLLSWNKWWKEMVAWSLIGIIAGFFLYLGFLMISMINNNFTFIKQSNITLAGWGSLGLMNSILPYLIPLVLLHIAYKELKSTQAMFAKEVIEMPEKAAKMGVAAGVGIMTGGTGIAALAPLTRATGALRERMERIPLVGQAIGGPGAYRASEKKRTQAETKELENKDSFDLHAVIRQPGISTYKRSRAIGILAKRGDLEITPDEAALWLPEAERHGEDMREIGSVRPDYAPFIPRPRPLPGAPPPPPPPLGVTPQDWAITQQVTRMKANTARDINRLALENEVVVRSLNRDQIQDFTRSGSPQQKQNIVNTIRNITGAVPGAFAPIPAVGPPINGIDRTVINYIADQQALGTWPV